MTQPPTNFADRARFVRRRCDSDPTKAFCYRPAVAGRNNAVSTVAHINHGRRAWGPAGTYRATIRRTIDPLVFSIWVRRAS